MARERSNKGPASFNRPWDVTEHFQTKEFRPHAYPFRETSDQQHRPVVERYGHTWVAKVENIRLTRRTTLIEWIRVGKPTPIWGRQDGRVAHANTLNIETAEQHCRYNSTLDQALVCTLSLIHI